MNPRRRTKKKDDAPPNTAILPYVAGVTEKIGRILRLYHLKTSFRPLRKVGRSDFTKPQRMRITSAFWTVSDAVVILLRYTPSLGPTNLGTVTNF